MQISVFRKKLEDVGERLGHCGVEDCLDELFTEEDMTSIKEFWQKGNQCFPSKIMRILGESKPISIYKYFIIEVII